MKTRLHLLSAPWPLVAGPSIQIGSLRAYIDKVFQNKIETRTYTMYFEISFACKNTIWPDFYIRFKHLGEYAYLLLYHQTFSRNKKLTPKEVSAFLNKVSRTDTQNHGPLEKFKVLSAEDLSILETATNDYIKNKIAPNLLSDGLNVVGFTLNFDQIYASIYVEKFLLMNFPQYKFLFLYGGYSAGAPSGIKTLANLGASGYCVIGEGERKLEQILRAVSEKAFLLERGKAVLPTMPGILRPQEFSDAFHPPESFFASQFPNLEGLPLPDYSEFFESYHQKVSQQPYLRRSHYQPAILLEGTRGCFAHCDFCSLNSQWRGFRKMSAEDIFDRGLEATQRYQCQFVIFTDNVCDTWAERFCEIVAEKGATIKSYMQLRAHHKEDFWVKLAKGGLVRTQIGIEALSQPLLKHMSKGTRVIQNLVAQKCISELEIQFYASIITQHPKSTPADVNETKRILEMIPHMAPYRVSIYDLHAKSPIFDSLTEKEQKSVRIKNIVPLPPKLKNYLAITTLSKPPSVVGSPALQKKWRQFESWYLTRKRKLLKEGLPTLSCKTNSRGQVTIVDTRYGAKKRYLLKGDEARIFQECHRGPSQQALLEAMSWSPERLQKAISPLLKKKIVLQTEDYFLSLPLRSRSELIPENRNEGET